MRGLAIIGAPGANSTGVTINGGGAVVTGNFIGLRADGSTAGLAAMGVLISPGIGNTRIGGGNAADANVINASGSGVYVYRGSDNQITGNLIGTSASGSIALSNATTGFGVALAGDSIGAANSNAIAMNLIASFNDGVRISGATNSLVVANTLGVGVGGAALGNMLYGIYIASSDATTPAHGNRISDNIVTASSRDAIRIAGSPGWADPYGNSIDTYNAIWGNAGLGIKLVPASGAVTGAYPNDAGDTDSGPNGLQNYPGAVSAVANAVGGVDISFTLDSQPGTYTVAAYANSTFDPSANGQGQYPAPGNAISVTVTGSPQTGVLTIPGPLPVGWAAGQYVSLLATNSATQDTSEFSGCAQIGAAPPPTPGVATPVPTLSQWGMAILSLLTAGLAVVGLFRRGNR